MGDIHNIWLCLALLPCLLVGSKELVCKRSALGKSDKRVSSELSADYGLKNIKENQTIPWVGNFAYPENNSKTLWVELDFKSEILVPYISMKGVYVSGFRFGQSSEEKCYVKKFVLDYKTAGSGKWIHHRKTEVRVKFESNTGEYDCATNITEPITALRILIRKWYNCPAVILGLRACGVCSRLPNKDGQSLRCSDYNETCTYSCKSGYSGGNVTKRCDLDGQWKGDDLTCQSTNPIITNHSPLKQSVQFGEKLELFCDVSGLPPITVSWYKDGEYVTRKSHDSPARSTFTKESVTLDDAGTYLCYAKNDDGQARQHMIIAVYDIDECTQNKPVCDGNARCTNTIGSFMCKCNTGYVGDGKTCSDLNECVHNDDHKYCDKHGDCQNTPGSYSCQCRGGYTGSGLVCTDINECRQNIHGCDSNAKCTNTDGSFTCKCKSGYTGDGKKCSDINECTQHKGICGDSNAICINDDGSYTCNCKTGFDGDGAVCSDIDECKDPKSCNMHGNCTNNPGSYSCACHEGYGGNICSSGTKPTITRHSQLDQTVRFGDKLELFCEASGSPPPSVIWYIKRKARYENVYKNINGSGRSTLTIENVTLNDAGRYKCNASNTEGSDEKDIMVFIDGSPWPFEISAKPDVESIMISWKITNHGASDITKYIIHLERELLGKEKWERNGTDTNFNAVGLKPNRKYTISVVAVNDYGNISSHKLSVTTKKPSPAIIPKPEVEMPSSKTVKILLTGMKNTTFVSRIQIVVEIKSSRRRRQATDPPKEILDYERAIQKGDKRYVTGEVEKLSKSFVVGDGKQYGAYMNKELGPGKYAISLRGVWVDSNKDRSYGPCSETVEVTIGKATGGQSGNNGSNVIGIAVGISVFALVIIVLVILMVYMRTRSPKTLEVDAETGKKKRRKRSFNSEMIPLTKKFTNKRKSSGVDDGLPDPNHPPVAVAAFAKHVGKLHKSDDRGFMIQYNTLESNQTYSSEIASLEENKDKNRYANIIAYDVSRVLLQQIGDDEHSDYINASFVDGYNSPSAYIATQGPLVHTFNDFWRMIWEKNCPAIVMLTNLQERHKIKCHKYWPEDSEKYGEITVMATRREQYADYVIRTFHLKMEFLHSTYFHYNNFVTVLETWQTGYRISLLRHFRICSVSLPFSTFSLYSRWEEAEKSETGEEREIKQFHFTVWPDHGVPEYPTAILAFQRRVRAYCTREAGPLVVHCSAGVGRSGTFIVIDSMLARIKHEQTIDIYNYVRYLRTRRMFMVQTEEQYVFCHDALLESVLCGNTQIAAHNMRIELNKLKARDESTKLTGYETEFKTLNKVSPSLPKECFIVASYPENLPKNRYPDILASDHGRIALTEIDDNVITTYINAVFVDGYKQQNAFILTQVPLTETINDFWRMIHEKRSACVLLLSDLSEEGDFPQFWPENGANEYDLIKVELASDAGKSDNSSEDQFHQDRLSEDLVERKFKLTKEDNKPLVVKMFQHLSWKETAVPSDVSSIVSLIQRIEKWQQRSGNAPITVVCKKHLEFNVIDAHEYTDSDGLGRSGTFAALCSVLERVKTEQVVDVFQTIKALRIQRPGLVKDVDQYEFIHLGVQEYLDSFSDYANFK